MSIMRDYKCGYKEAPEMDDSVFDRLNILPVEAYIREKDMVKLALELKKRRERLFCEIPFCHTLEAEALGARVCYGGSSSVPRIREYAYSSIAQVLSHPGLRTDKGRIKEVLGACRELSEQGEHIIMKINGPFTILSLLMDIRHIASGLHKSPDLMERIYKKLGSDLLRLAEAAVKAGADIISYADSSGGIDVLGPRNAAMINEMFTCPFLLELKKLILGKASVFLCPKITFMLLDMGRAELRSFYREERLSYDQACMEAVGKVSFFGQICIEELRQKKTGRLLKEVVLKEEGAKAGDRFCI